MFLLSLYTVCICRAVLNDTLLCFNCRKLCATAAILKEEFLFSLCYTEYETGEPQWSQIMFFCMHYCKMNEMAGKRKYHLITGVLEHLYFHTLFELLFSILNAGTGSKEKPIKSVPLEVTFFLFLMKTNFFLNMSGQGIFA